MSSSSNGTQERCDLSKEEEGKGGKKDWLELALGFGSDDSSNLAMIHGSESSFSAFQSSSSSCFPSHSSIQGQQMALRLRIGCETDDLCPEVYHGLWRENRHLWFRKDHLPISASELHLNTATSNFLDSHSLFSRPPNVANHYSQRPNPGLWFTLLSTSNREGKVLPQIPKPYIRVKDSNVTVFMVKTYLVRKLGLSNEAESILAVLNGQSSYYTTKPSLQNQVEISCMGQNLLDSQTLKHVRDGIWLSKLVEFLNSNPTLVKDTKFLHRLMSLEYGRSCLINKEV